MTTTNLGPIRAATLAKAIRRRPPAATPDALDPPIAEHEPASEPLGLVTFGVAVVGIVLLAFAIALASVSIG